MNTPKFKLRVCHDHENTTAKISDYFKDKEIKKAKKESPDGEDNKPTLADSKNNDTTTSSDDSDENAACSEENKKSTKKQENGIYQGVIKICGTKQTRTSILYEVHFLCYVIMYLNK